MALQASFLNSSDSESAKYSQDQWFDDHAGWWTQVEFSPLNAMIILVRSGESLQGIVGWSTSERAGMKSCWRDVALILLATKTKMAAENVFGLLSSTACIRGDFPYWVVLLALIILFLQKWIFAPTAFLCPKIYPCALKSTPALLNLPLRS